MLSNNSFKSVANTTLTMINSRINNTLYTLPTNNYATISKVIRSNRGVRVKSSDSNESSTTEAPTTASSDESKTRKRINFSSIKDVLKKKREERELAKQQQDENGVTIEKPKMILKESKSTTTTTTADGQIKKKKETIAERLSRLEREIEDELKSRKKGVKPTPVAHGEDPNEQEVAIGEENKTDIEKEMRRKFWASQMTMRDSLKRDGGEYLFDEKDYSETETGYNQLGHNLMSAKERERARLLAERRQRQLEIMEARKNSPEFANLPSPDEYFEDEDNDGNGEDNMLDLEQDEFYNDGLPDMTRIEVESNIPPKQELIEEFMEKQRQELIKKAETNSEDDFEKRRKLKRIEFMTKKLALQEKQRRERLERLGIVEDNIVEIDPHLFNRFQSGEITEEEMKELSRNKKEQEDAEEQEDDENGEEKSGRKDYEFLRHWKIGSIEIPTVLKRKISQAIKGYPTQKLRQDAAELSENLRNRTRSEVIDKNTPFKVAPEEKPVITYGKGQALAYIAHRLPGVYACTHRVFQEIATRIPNFKPQTMLDYGSGPGTVIWSARETWDSIKSIRAIEPSGFMVEVAKKMLEGQTNGILWSQLISPPTSEAYQSDLVVASYVLSELPDQATREKVVHDLWRNVKPSGMLVLVEPGTPIGFSLVRSMRQFLLDLPADQVTVHKQHFAQVVAPCPHSSRCPMGHNSWCHFSQRVVRPVFQKLAKGPASTVSFEDEKYSYIVMSKLVRSTIPNQLENQFNIYGAEEQEAKKPWSRINEAPFKRGGHVTLDVCSPEGDLKRVTIAKSHGKKLYKETRKSFWSDGLVIDEPNVHWIESRHQIVETPEQIEQDKKANIDKVRAMKSISFKNQQKEINKAIEEIESTPAEKKKKELQTQKKQDNSWMDELGKDDRNMLERLVKEGKFSNSASSLFGDDDGQELKMHQDYREMKQDDSIEFLNDKPATTGQDEIDVDPISMLRDSSRARKAIKERLREDIETFEMQNLQPDELEQMKQIKGKTVKTRQPKKGSMEAFLLEEELQQNNDNDNIEAMEQKLESQRLKQLEMTSLVENVRGMGLNTKDRRKKQPFLNTSSLSIKKK